MNNKWLATIKLVSCSVLFSAYVLASAIGTQVRHPYASGQALAEPIIFSEGIISTGDDESHPAFTPDGKTLYFLKNTPLFNHWTIAVSQYRNGKWDTPEVASFSGQYSDADPFITEDGKNLFFISTRPVDGKAKEDTDIWMVEKKASGWSEPTNLGPLINSNASEWFPTLTKDGTLYFGSDRPGGKGRTDIWRCKLINGKYGEPENLGDAINSPASEVEPYIAPDESFIIFAAAGRPDGKGAFDLYISYNKNGSWTKGESLGDKINSKWWDFSPKISPDGKYFFFTSNRNFADQPLEKPLSYNELVSRLHSPRNGLRDIYQIDISALKLKP
jgi:Tol biopolymer transport system component